MTKQQKLGLVLYTIGLTCAAAIYLNGRANPTYRGKTLTAWCEQFQTTATPGPKEEARGAIRAMTLNSLPRLVEDLNYDPPDSKKVLRNKLRNSLYGFLPLV